MDYREIEQLAHEAQHALRSGDHVRALAVIDQLAMVVPDDPALQIMRAEALLKSGAGEEALSEARKAVALDPESYRAQSLLGVAAWRLGKLHLAQQSLERAIELSRRRPAALTDYAWFMASERGPRLAEEAAREAVGADEESSTAWAALGLAQLRLHRRQDAEASLEKALQLDPNDPYAQWVMVSLLHEQRRDASAVALTDLLAQTPGTEDFVARVRREAKKRQVSREVVERNPAWHTTRGRRRFSRLWLFGAALLLAGLLVALLGWWFRWFGE
ncbi:MAG: tetratricopeptide repeat protein [Planctomycetota bacterium]